MVPVYRTDRDPKELLGHIMKFQTADLLVSIGFARSKLEAKRLLRAGAVDIDGRQTKAENLYLVRYSDSCELWNLDGR
jgi:tyrosyl-tRNA synthetase